MKGISEFRRGCLVGLTGVLDSLVLGSSVLAQTRVRVSSGILRRLVRLTVRLVGIRAARRLRVIIGMLLGSGWTAFRTV